MYEYKKLIKAAEKGHKQWLDAANAGDADGCASVYEENATVYAGELGIHKGKAAIRDLWANVISQGFANVAFQDVKMYVQYIDKNVKSNAVVFSSLWSSDIAKGVVYNELWILQENDKKDDQGKRIAKLSCEAFEVTKWFES